MTPSGIAPKSPQDYSTPSSCRNAPLDDLARFHELQLWKAFLGQVEIDPARGQIDVVAGAVARDVVAERVDDRLDLVVAPDNPARRRALIGIEDRIDTVLVFQAMRDNVELQRADGAEDQVVGRDGSKHLGRAFLGQLVQALLQLLHPQRIAQPGTAKMFRRKRRNAGELERLALGEGVAQADRPVVGNADDVAGEGLVGGVAILRHEGDGIVDGEGFAGRNLQDLHAAR